MLRDMAKKKAKVAKKAAGKSVEELGIDGARVKKRREALGITQEQLYARTLIGAHVISEVELCKKGLHTATFRKLALGLGCSLDYLAGLTEDPTPK
jgi:transcriptional regulator with XRE-family HTH domain